MDTKVESASVPASEEVKELALLETLKALLNTAVRSLSRGEPPRLVEISRSVQATAEQLIAASTHMGRLPLTPDAQQQRKRQLVELHQQRCFCHAMLRRWRRSILLRQQLLDLATEPATYTEPLEPRWYSHE